MTIEISDFFRYIESTVRIVWSDEERNLFIEWTGGSGFDIVSVPSFEAVDCWTVKETPRSFEEACRIAEQHMSDQLIE